MDIERLLTSGNLVLEVDALLAREQAFFSALLFEMLHLLALTNRRPTRDLLFFIDEGQLLARQGEVASKLLQLRHYGVHLIINFQNASEIPVEVQGNVDGLVCFRQTDARDRAAIGRTMSLSRDQEARLARLDPGECVCLLPATAWKHPFFARTQPVAFA